MGLYGSKNQHPKLTDTESENKRLESIEWVKCEHCGKTHLKQYKECPYCTYRRKQPIHGIHWIVLTFITVVALIVRFGEFDIGSNAAPTTTTSAPIKIPTLYEQLESLGGDPVYISSDVSILSQCGVTDVRHAELVNDSGAPDHVVDYRISYGDNGELYLTFKKGSLTNLTFAGTLLYSATVGVQNNINTVIEENTRIRIAAERIREQERREAAEALERRQQAEAFKKQQEAQAAAIQREKEVEARYKESCMALDYDSISRNPDKYNGNRYTFTGKIMQVTVSDIFDTMSALIFVNEGEYGWWSDLVYVSFPYNDGDDLLLEDDIVTVWGECAGAHKYITTLLTQNIVPEINVEYFELK